MYVYIHVYIYVHIYIYIYMYEYIYIYIYHTYNIDKWWKKNIYIYINIYTGNTQSAQIPTDQDDRNIYMYYFNTT